MTAVGFGIGVSPRKDFFWFELRNVRIRSGYKDTSLTFRG